MKDVVFVVGVVLHDNVDMSFVNADACVRVDDDVNDESVTWHSADLAMKAEGSRTRQDRSPIAYLKTLCQARMPDAMVLFPHSFQAPVK